MGLSLWQAKRQMAFLAANAPWVESPGSLVFHGGSFVSEQLEGMFLGGSVAIDGPKAIKQTPDGKGLDPFCRVATGQVRWDRDSVGRIENLSLLLWLVAGDWYVQGSTSVTGYDTNGLNQVIGTLRDTTAGSFGQGESQGRDIDELLGRFVEWIGDAGFVDSIHGFQGQASICEKFQVVVGSQTMKRSLQVDVLNPCVSNYYHYPSAPNAAPGAGSSAVISWGQPPLRYDSLGVAVYRGAAGAPAPPYGSGIFIGLIPWGTNTVTDSTVSGGDTYNYSLFGAYAETPVSYAAKTVERISQAMFATVTLPG
jgi:hypothetical protein